MSFIGAHVIPAKAEILSLMNTLFVGASLVSAQCNAKGYYMKHKDMSSYEGKQKYVRSMKLPDIEVWENQYADRDFIVDLEIPEFTCICPKTGLPDFALIKVSYKPDLLCLELKSLKMYLVQYRQIGIFHEHLVNRLIDDCVKACQPRWMKVVAVMNPRGGIGTTVTVEYFNRPKTRDHRPNARYQIPDAKC